MRRTSWPISCHDLRGQPEERLVDHEQARPGHEPPGDGHHLLLASRERVGELPAPGPHHGEQRLHPGQGLVAMRARPGIVGAEQHVVAHGEERKEPAPLEHVGDAVARRAVRRQTVDALVRNAMRPARGESSPEMVFIRVDLPAPLGPSTQTISPASTRSSAPHSTWKSP